MSSASPLPPARTLWRRWLLFWFAPTDPTTLSFIRVVTGCLCVYTHLAYSFDLQAFFGKDAWYGLEYINRERREMPHQLAPLDWTDPPRSAQLPESPPRKAAFAAYYRDLTGGGVARADRGLAYVERLQRSGSNDVIRDGLTFVDKLSPNPEFRRNELAKVGDELLWDKKNDQVAPPMVVNGLPNAERKKVADEIEAFYQSLPAGDDRRTKDARVWVLDHWADLDPAGRAALVRFAREVAALPEAERAARLDYLEYWNVEQQFLFRTGSPIFSLWFHVTDPTAMAAAHAVVLVVMVLFTLGAWTRVTSVLTWLAAVSYVHRSQQILFGMDTMLNILLIYLMIGQSGATLSVDRLVNRYRAVRASLRRSGTVDPATAAYLAAPPPSAASGFAIRLLQIHFGFIYMASGMSKLKGPAWWNTNAFWDTLVNPEFTLIHYRWYESLLRAVVENRAVFGAVAAVGVAFTFVAELGLPFLVWTRLRPWIVMFALLLHAGIAVFMGLWVFSLLMMTMLLGYLPGGAIRYRLFGGASPATDRVTVRVNARSDRQARAAALAKAADFDDRLDVAPAAVNQSADDGVRVDAGGRELAGSAAVKDLFTRLVWLRPVRWLLVVPGVVRAFAGTGPAAPAPARPPHAPAAS